MLRNKVYVIVEGHGEADPPRPGQDPAAKVLVIKMLQHVQCWHWFPAKRKPWRLSSCGDFYPHTEKLLAALDAHREFADCAAVLVLFDLDDGCPYDIAPAVAGQIRDRGPWPFSVVVVCAYREYESWFLASLDAIHPGHHYPDDAESLRDAKGWLRRNFGYRQVRDQAGYTSRLDTTQTQTRSRSFRRLCHAFEELVQANHDSQLIVTPSV
ncbi:MAG: hypothetical protein JXA89_23180 [Anaerolineae bacterium]|nr:hypothetical protein [Anaerolineae bacterium]